MSTPLLAIVCLVVPAAWGCLMETLLRRVWKRQTGARSAEEADRHPPVDFQI
jgi:hypothetical protein